MSCGPTIDAIKEKLEEEGVETNFVYVHHSQTRLFQMAFPILC